MKYYILKIPKRRIIQITIIFILAISGTTGNSQDKKSFHDWSQWRGADRNGIWDLDLQKESLVADDLVKLWEVPVSQGYGGPTVADGKVYLMDLIGETSKMERILCIDAGSGELIWKHEYKCLYERVGYPTGPRASVLIDEGRAYSFGTMGDLYCLDAESGEVIWYVSGIEEYNSRIPVWGLAASPLIEMELLIVQIAGQPEACLVAFDKVNGTEVWKSLPDEASYSSPIVIDQAGKRVLICWTGDNVAGLDPGTGKVYWKIPFERRKGIINIATPVYHPPFIFLSSFWDGSMLLKLGENHIDAELVWARAGKNERFTDALHCCISTPVIKDDYVYGIDSYGEFRCLELTTGDRIWTDSTLVPYGRWVNVHFVKQDNNYWAFNERGELVLIRLSSSGHHELGRVHLINPVNVHPNPRGGVNWAHPAFSGRRIYVRSDAALICYELMR